MDTLLVCAFTQKYQFLYWSGCLLSTKWIKKQIYPFIYFSTVLWNQIMLHRQKCIQLIIFTSSTTMTPAFLMLLSSLREKVLWAIVYLVVAMRSSCSAQLGKFTYVRWQDLLKEKPMAMSWSDVSLLRLRSLCLVNHHVLTSQLIYVIVNDHIT